MALQYWLLVAAEILTGVLVIYEINSPKSTYRQWRERNGK